MKKLIALIGMAGLITVGCAHRDRDHNMGGTYDESISTSGSSASTSDGTAGQDKTSNSGNRSKATETHPEGSSSDTSNNSKSTEKTP
jgi:hypothetical protein